MHTIEINKALGAGFQGLSRQPITLTLGLFCAGLLAGMGQALVQGIAGVFAKGGLPGQLIGLGVGVVGNLAMTSYFTLGIMAMCLAASRGQQARLGMLSDGGRVWIPALVVVGLTGLGTWLLLVPMGLAVAGLGIKGLLLSPVLLLPPILFWLANSQALYLVLDRDVDALTAMRASWELTRGHRMQVFSVYFVCAGLFVVLSLACALGITVLGRSLVGGLVVFVGGGLGLISLLVVTQVALAHVYDRLRGADEQRTAAPRRSTVVGVA